MLKTKLILNTFSQFQTILIDLNRVDAQFTIKSNESTFPIQYSQHTFQHIVLEYECKIY